ALKALTGPDSSSNPVGVVVVADGMGGHTRGGQASSTAVRVASGILVREILLPLIDIQEADARRRPIQEILTEATQSANRSVCRMEVDTGTTLTSVLIADHSAYVAHVGDCRVYYLADGKTEQITRDHSLVRRLVDLGEISPEEALSHPQRNLLYRALGQEAELEVDTYFQRLAKGSYLVVCSDGLWNNVSQEEMSEVIAKASTPQEACNRLIDRANDVGGEDNITIVLALINY
ncbi:MAG TPA: serine/threonine-protein phosphatase, partial [Chloroflexi bacterium]|nr:serine/threonine-protein phosphatase [Chloroflexota bacterium]